MTANELRKKFLEFFKERGHKIIPSVSLIPENNPTVLFTTAGMHPLIPYLLGEKHPLGNKLVDVQKCLRTGDIDEVGDAWHLTFFEMLGNWSLGDSSSVNGIGATGYWKKEAIAWSFEFLTDKKWLGIPLEKLCVTVFAGDEDVLRDEETAQIWQKLGIPPEKFFYLSKEDNWWGPVGETGPCGPDTEIFYDTGKPKCGFECRPGCKCGKYSEVWNNVFMEYSKTEFGKYEPLKQKNVDTGMGVERTIAILNGYDNVYETELFKPIIEKIKILGSRAKNLPDSIVSHRIIADHLKAATFILGDEKGVTPSNLGRGYVLRRLIRRAVRHGRLLGIKDVFTFEIAEPIIKIYQDIYPELKKNREFIIEQLICEEEKFKQTLERGLREFEKIAEKKLAIDDNLFNGEEVFYLYDTFGFPFELTREMALEHRLKIDEYGFKEALRKHQELSRTASAGMFKGGLNEANEKTIKLHTATHLLLAALRQILGSHVFQRGSNITVERLRLDFSHSEKMTREQIKQVEDLVNQKIKKNLTVKHSEMSLNEAKKQEAIGVFEAKYGEKVKVYIIGDFSTSSESPFSREICGGPHVDSTGCLGYFKILKEETSGAGVRRIKAILEPE